MKHFKLPRESEFVIRYRYRPGTGGEDLFLFCGESGMWDKTRPLSQSSRFTKAGGIQALADYNQPPDCYHLFGEVVEVRQREPSDVDVLLV